MAGPHVAGIVGLIREANPSLDVDTIKKILMQTARDEGTVGEDNTYGWGTVDAFAAVQAATVGYGAIEGTVRNSSYGNTPIQGARVKIISAGNQATTDAAGFYHLSAAAGMYSVEASHPSFRPDTAMVIVNNNQVTLKNWSLVDIAGPAITNVTPSGTTTDIVGPYAVNATITDLQRGRIGEAVLPCEWRRLGGSGDDPYGRRLHRLDPWHAAGHPDRLLRLGAGQRGPDHDGSGECADRLLLALHHSELLRLSGRGSRRCGLDDRSGRRRRDHRSSGSATFRSARPTTACSARRTRTTPRRPARSAS